MSKILLVVDRCFLPATTDGSTRVYDAWLKALTRLGHSVSVLSFDFPRVRWQKAGLAELDRYAERRHIVPLVSGPVLAATLRGGQLGWNWLSGRTNLPGGLNGPWSPAARRAMVDFLRAERHDAVIVQKVHTTELMGTALLASLPGRKIVDVHDNVPKRMELAKAWAKQCLVSLSWGRIKELRREEVEALLHRGSIWRGLAEEVRLLTPYDEVLFAAPEEMASFIGAGLDPARCRTWAWGLNGLEETAASSAEPAAHYDIGFIGSGNLLNVDALRFLGHGDPAAPDQQARPAGHRPACRRRDLGLHPRVRQASRNNSVPWVDDLAGFYRSVGLILVPLFGGTGVSIKSIEAAQFGMAMLSTAQGMRGLQFRPGEDVEIAETADEFATAAVALIADPDRRRVLGANARRQAEERHSLAAFTAAIGALIDR